ncbi:type II toxin-antitoxin system VapC family toxin [Methanosphaera cuniculi]|uniref:Fcf1 n=2 Tax=Methanosphaera cuniculi TaxID=1077256 RepID=A0A2V2BL27_9EURY|nr:PIN domain-containing protein [Methanosphaera cuniculi]PWL08642.1 Fcf1 [Methanosphaera cuniculi]
MESSKCKAIIDTNFLMMMFQLKVDVVNELKLKLPSYYELIVPSVILDELSLLKKTLRGKDKLAASMAYQYAQQKPFKVIDVQKDMAVDDVLLNLCDDKDVLCTNDKNLRRRARKRGINVIYLRQHKFLEVDGYIN